MSVQRVPIPSPLVPARYFAYKKFTSIVAVATTLERNLMPIALWDQVRDELRRHT